MGEIIYEIAMLLRLSVLLLFGKELLYTRGGADPIFASAKVKNAIGRIGIFILSIHSLDIHMYNSTKYQMPFQIFDAKQFNSHWITDGFKYSELRLCIISNGSSPALQHSVSASL